MANIPNAHQMGQLYELSDSDRQLLQCRLLNIYDDIVDLCSKHNLICMLGGGSCLGAVRHQGFIPWDDDLDLMMPRNDYDIFIGLCAKGMLGSQYEFSFPSRYVDSKNTFLKIYKKNTTNIELYDDSTPFPKGIYIDVFPMECAPHSRLKCILKGGISRIFRMICNSVLFSQYPSEKYKEYLSNDYKGLILYNFRIVVGKIFGIIDHKWWVYWFDRFNSSMNLTGYTTIPTGRKNYIGERLPDDVFYPVSKAVFEGRMANIPNDYDKYLRNLYGNYMEIPPVEKRERHLVYRFKCD